MPRLKHTGPGRRRLSVRDLNVNEWLVLASGGFRPADHPYGKHPRGVRWESMQDIAETWADVGAEYLERPPLRLSGRPWAARIFDDGLTPDEVQQQMRAEWKAYQKALAEWKAAEKAAEKAE